MILPESAFVALGSNLGDRHGFLALARTRLSGFPRTALVAESSMEETAPIGPVQQGPYLNQMVLLSTELSPRELLRHCHDVEEEAGRVRGERWGARTLDLDIVRFGDRVEESDDLVLPHPEFSNRAFWRREVAELERYLKLTS